MIEKNKLGRTNLLVSRLGLGTTRLGYAYGIGSIHSVPNEEEVITLLKKAVSLGVTLIDTAHYYGSAEERIGASGVLNAPGVVVITKCGHHLDRGEVLSLDEMRKTMRAEVLESLQKLKLKKLSLLQLHGGSIKQIEDGSLISVLQGFKDEGLVEYVGISTRGEEVPRAAIKSGFFDTIQVGYSIFDQRLKKEILPLATKHGVGVINRSAFLKGVLAGVAKEFPQELTPLAKGLEQVKNIADELKIDLPSLAIRFAISNPDINISLVGTKNIKHLKNMVRAVEAGPLPKDILEKLSSLAISDPSQVDPKQWPASFHK